MFLSPIPSPKPPSSVIISAVSTHICTAACRGAEPGLSLLDRYLTLRPNLKTRDHYRRIFIPNSALADPIIEGLVKAGWEPEE